MTSKFRSDQEMMDLGSKGGGLVFPKRSAALVSCFCRKPNVMKRMTDTTRSAGMSTVISQITSKMTYTAPSILVGLFPLW
jgi:hypothetical protein